MITLESTYKAMSELVQQGQADGKLALWAAALSVRNRLEVNCRQAQVMHQYAHKPLPSPTVLREQLGAILTRTLNTLYAIETLWGSGAIHLDAGYSYESQFAWRARMVALIPGMAEKTVSFALHIYDPWHCQLLTIDCWHVRRMRSVFGAINKKNYVLYENQLMSDIHSLAGDNLEYPIIVYAAYLWELERTGSVNGDYSSHAGLSCYISGEGEN